MLTLSSVLFETASVIARSSGLVETVFVLSLSSLLVVAVSVLARSSGLVETVVELPLSSAPVVILSVLFLSSVLVDTVSVRGCSISGVFISWSMLEIAWRVSCFFLTITSCVIGSSNSKSGPGVSLNEGLGGVLSGMVGIPQDRITVASISGATWDLKLASSSCVLSSLRLFAHTSWLSS